ncbi:immunity repressor [Mycobacterium phage Typha]|uniref:Immunity repressor n=1 Tax=Mycobacterium phage Typha TaxID=2517971 RepID=A0A482JAG7_9CAUD|nr:transcriptional repressor [Mycobacterium phage Typha]QBP29708.1 immunity repressor [Mycobacterium phage Typha]URM86495.1 immunity repressor [Mycobacterium phage Hilltopfarm]
MRVTIRDMTSAYEKGFIPPNRLKYRLWIAREEAGLSQQELADAMGVTRHVISNAERGVTRPRKVVLNAWALACGVPVSWLESGIGEFVPPSPDDDTANKVRPEGFEPPTFWFGTQHHLRLVDGDNQQTRGAVA